MDLIFSAYLLQQMVCPRAQKQEDCLGVARTSLHLYMNPPQYNYMMTSTTQHMSTSREHNNTPRVMLPFYTLSFAQGVNMTKVPLNEYM